MRMVTTARFTGVDSVEVGQRYVVADARKLLRGFDAESVWVDDCLDASVFCLDVSQGRVDVRAIGSSPLHEELILVLDKHVD